MTLNFSDIANISTALAVIFAAWQLRLSKKQATTAFEDSLAKEYRKIAARLPTKAFLGEHLTEIEHADSFDEMHRYFDLCNQQAFLAAEGRITKETWKFWKDGITSNMNRPAFKHAWFEIAERSSGDFTELRAIAPPKFTLATRLFWIHAILAKTVIAHPSWYNAMLCTPCGYWSDTGGGEGGRGSQGCGDE